MKKILLSLSIIIAIASFTAVGGTGAFFSDNENSIGNTFAAGAIDLKIDNTSYYNGVFNPNTSWSLEDLTIQKFFNFLDLKPGDRGEDTISIHIDNNDAYLCANVKLTSNDDNGLNEPEALVDATDGPGLGELASEVKFVWWADDGDNVLENNENIISSGPIGALGLNGSTTIPLADSQNNIWTGVGGPAIGGVTQYIGKAWCFGNISGVPLVQDGLGTTSPRTPANSSGGIACDGAFLNNATQSDSLTADVTFTAVQARNNPGFLCTPPRETAKLTVVKVVTNDNGGNNIVADFNLFVDDGFVSTNVSSGVEATLPVGTYGVSETGVSGYVASFSGDCDSEGNITLNPGDDKICTITNNDLSPNITLIKVVTGTPPLADPSLFRMRVDGTIVPNTTSLAVTSNTPHVITEDPRAGYSFVSITGAGCPSGLGSSSPIVLSEGQAITCTITNNKN